MDRPPGGWSDLVTNQMLGARLDALRSDLVAEIAMVRTEIGNGRAEIADVRAEIAGVRSEIANVAAALRDELRGQTWRLSGLIFVAFGIVAALVRAG